MPPDSTIDHEGYRVALRWLYSLSPNARTAAEVVADHPRKLARTRALLDLVGSPDRAFDHVLVAGTKGKGSIAAFTDAILRAGGARTGLVTSPHLMSWCERTRIDSQDIEPEAVATLMPRVRDAVDRLGTMRPALGAATTFEAGLALSLLAFAEASVEVAVVEAGVGALHDATNVVDPLAVALGPISYDHLGTLGSTLSAIATEKAGVFRAGRVAVTAAQPAEARVVVERVAGERGARLEVVGQDWCWHAAAADACHGPFSVDGPRGSFTNLTIPLLGRHQRENATAAVALATEAMRRLGGPAGHLAPEALESSVRSGLASVRWPGRLQIVQDRPLLVLDGAHNGDSARRLVEAIRECFGGRRLHLVFGTSVGKDVPRMLDALVPAATTVTLTRSAHERSVPLNDLLRTLWARGVAAQIEPNVAAAVERALDRADSDDLVLVTGSLFVVGEALEARSVGAVPAIVGSFG